MADQRPTADALLARLKERDRPRLRIYIGAAPGVGKSYEMLQEGHALRARGLDVVIGLIETYDRPDTAAQVRDLRYALDLYHRERGSYPRRLDELVEDRWVGRDQLRMSGYLVQYRPLADGQDYTLNLQPDR